MAKQSGIGWQRAVRRSYIHADTAPDLPTGTALDLVDIKDDVTNVDFATPRGTQEITGLDKSAMERLLLLADYSSTWNGVFNPSPNKSHAIHKRMSSQNLSFTEMLAIAGHNIENEVLVTDYALTRSTSGEFTWSAPAVLQDGARPQWGSYP